MKKIAYALWLVISLGMVMTGCSTTSNSGADTAAASQEKRGVSDASITAAVEDVFQQDELLGPENIEVDTQEGVVMLAARMSSGRAANRAISLAREVPGVQRVVWSRLELTP
jgi:osmotically-inducible protein OsmY